MTRIAVIGGTGYAGSHLVKEALDRGHTVVSIARSVPAERVEGATYLEGSILDVTDLVHKLEGVEVVVSAVAPRGDMAGKVRPAIAELIAALPENVRVGIIGGAGGSLVAPGGARVVDTDGFGEDYKPEALEAIGVLEDLRSGTGGREWFYIHPAGGFGVWAPGERTGQYRDGGEVIVTDDKGESFISGPDLAVAIVDEIEDPQHVNGNFAVGY
ncbi:NAD(P)-dependent oxidoreductase [Microbacterium sp. NPDC091313]